jgi:hypothetical protein
MWPPFPLVDYFSLDQSALAIVSPQFAAAPRKLPVSRAPRRRRPHCDAPEFGFDVAVLHTQGAISSSDRRFAFATATALDKLFIDPTRTRSGVLSVHGRA